ncbi:hypothetical protein POM88_045037 [Heracleum sosnowskyi]|uniref:beta-galactosidase n=1 Tax=Heracleum sosnowskyi TaxID=360622 RepID=A0AAD8H5N4_9APIA|nr:hypothetical protein POM88_045037 [Heracleum sosnowskyi]
MINRIGNNGYCTVVLVFQVLWFERGISVKVTYDHKALIIDGKRRILQSGSVHYPRTTPEVWPQIIQKAKEGGLDVIESYIFWNYHEPVKGEYYFEGRFDLVRFVKAVQEAGLFVHLRIGPYACAEWNYGSINVASPVPDCKERLVTITATENADSQYSAAQNAVILVFNKSTDAGYSKGIDSGGKRSHVAAQVVVSSNQVGCLLGKGGAIISEMRRATGAYMRIIGGDEVPKFVSENDQVVQQQTIRDSVFMGEKRMDAGNYRTSLWIDWIILLEADKAKSRERYHKRRGSETVEQREERNAKRRKKYMEKDQDEYQDWDQDWSSGLEAEQDSYFELYLESS